MKNSVPKSLNHYFYKSPSYNLDISNWDISKIKNMDYCFSGCRNLKSLDISLWDTSKVKNMNSCFYGCSSIDSLDLSSWNTSNVFTFEYCFTGCASLIYLNIENWFIETDYIYHMFDGCDNLSLIKCRQDAFEEFKRFLLGTWNYENGFAIKMNNK
mgnify:CR=1 FL=1